MSLSRLKRLAAKPETKAKPEPKKTEVTGDMVKLKTTHLKTGAVYVSDFFDKNMLMAWIEKNSGGSILKYEVVA